MAEKLISFAGQTLSITFPQQATEIINFTFFDFPEGSVNTTRPTIEVGYNTQNRLYTVAEDGQQIGGGLAPAELSLLLLSRSTYSLINDIPGGMAIHGAAIQHNNRAVLIPGKRNTGKSILTSWLLSRGYNYLTDELAYFPESADYFIALNRPIHINETGRHIIERFINLHNQQNNYLQSDKTTLLSHRIFDTNPIQHHPELSFLLFIEQNSNSTLAINSISPAQAAKRLMESLANVRNIGLHGFHQLTSLTKKTPAILLQYGNVEDLENVLEPVIDFVLENTFSPGSFQRFIQAFQTLSPKQSTAPENTKECTALFPIPKATKRGKKRKLTIGMATYDDYDGVYFSVQALQMYHPEITKECEILVIDNHPDGPCAENLKNMDQYVDGYRYVPLQDIQGTAVRDHIFIHATGDYVICMDCHVFIVPGAIKKLLDYFDKNPDCQDLLQGPMLYDGLVKCATHLKPVWRDGMYGIWKTDSRGTIPEGNPFEIPMQGLGLFACRKDAWQRFNPHFIGFGGEEGYIHEKFRQAGGRILCLPFLRWLHRFARPMGVPYTLQWKDRIWNYWLGFTELNLEIEPMKEHFRDLLGRDTAQKIFEEIKKEIASPFSFFDAIYCITLSTNSECWKQIRKHFQVLGVDKQIRVFLSTATPENQCIGHALSHRAILLSARQQHLKNVLIINDDSIFVKKAIHHLTKSIAELRTQPWNVFFLGGYRRDLKFENVSGCSYLQNPYGLPYTHPLTSIQALAYNNTIYNQILEELPDSIEKMEFWIQNNLSIDKYLHTIDGTLLASPSVTSYTA